VAGFGNANGTNVSSRGLSVSVVNCPAGGCTISFSFQADPFVMATIDAGANAGSVARGTLGFSVSLTNVATNAIVFNWTPDGSLGGIVGGTETSDPESLNSTFAAFPGQSITHSGRYAAGTFSSYSATTNALAAGNYTLSFAMSESTDVRRVAADTVPEPATCALIFVGFGVVGVMRRLRV
jgi:PEP-CTERM motif